MEAVTSRVKRLAPALVVLGVTQALRSGWWLTCPKPVLLAACLQRVDPTGDRLKQVGD